MSATIKLQNGKILLKNGKVSCGCCGDCCMYPAQALFDGLYTIDDLPDTIVEYPSDDSTPITFTKLSSPTPSQDPTVGAISYYQGIDQSGFLVGVGLREGNEWVGSEIGNEPAEFGECLLSIQTFQPDPLVWDSLQDQFADTYTVSGPVSGTVTRFDLCTWRGDGLTLRYDGRLDANFLPVGTFKWRVNGNNKSGFQNTPAGSYAGGFTVA